MRCPRCHEENAPDYSFCVYCGAPLHPQDEQAAEKPRPADPDTDWMNEPVRIPAVPPEDPVNTVSFTGDRFGVTERNRVQNEDTFRMPEKEKKPEKEKPPVSVKDRRKQLTIVASCLVVCILVLGVVFFLLNRSGSDSSLTEGSSLADQEETVQKQEPAPAQKSEVAEEKTEIPESSEVQETTENTEPVQEEEPKPDPVTYQLNYNMKTRKSPDYNGEEIKTRKKGETVQVYNTQTSSNNSVWGEIDSDGSGIWMCISDNDYTYLSRK